MSFRSCGCFPRMRSIWLRERGQDLWTICNIRSPGLHGPSAACGGRDVPSLRRPASRCRGILRPPAGAQLHLHTCVKGFRADRQTGRLSLCRSLKSTPRHPPSELYLSMLSSSHSQVWCHTRLTVAMTAKSPGQRSWKGTHIPNCTLCCQTSRLHSVNSSHVVLHHSRTVRFV